MAKKIFSVILVLLIVLSCSFVNSLGVLAYDLGDTVTIGVTGYISDDCYVSIVGNDHQVTLNGAIIQADATLSFNTGIYQPKFDDNGQPYLELIVHSGRSGSVRCTYSYNGSYQTVNVPAFDYNGIDLPVGASNVSVNVINYDDDILVDYYVYINLAVPDEPDNPNIEIDSNILFNILGAQNYDSGIMVDGADRVFYYDVIVDSFSCGFNSSNHLPISELNGHEKKYKVTLYNVPDGTSLSFDSSAGLTVVETSQLSSEYTYIINDDIIPDLTVNITFSSDEENIWEMYTIWIVVRDTYAQGYYHGYDVGYDEGYDDAIDDIGTGDFINSIVEIITNPIRAIMAFQLAEFSGTPITIGNIFYTIVGILLVIVFLKLFAGG